MQRSNRKLTYFMLIGLVLSVFMLSSFQIVGYVGFAMCILTALTTSRTIRKDKILAAALVCSTWIIIRLLLQIIAGNWYDNTTRSLLVQLMVFVYIVLIRNSKFKLDDWKLIFSIYALLILGISLYLLVTKQLEYSRYFGTMFGNMVLIGFGISLILSHVERIRFRKYIWCALIAVFIYLTYKSGMRSAVIGELLGVIFALYTSLRNESRRFNNFAFFSVVAICFIIPYVYLELYHPHSELMRRISSLSQYYVLRFTGKRMFSGRNSLWPYVLESLQENQLIGNGIGFTPGIIYNTSLSTHNLFLFIRSEQGIIGFVSFLVLLFFFWQIYYKQRVEKTVFFIQGFLVALLFQQTFSLGLIGGKGAFSIGCWTILCALSKLKEDI